MTAPALVTAVAAAMLVASGHGAAQSSDLPVRLQSIQHFYAITKRCETVAPDRTAIRAREAALDRLIDDAKSASGAWEPTSSATSWWCQRCR